MADKCWFVLKQTHYPPPILPIDGTGNVSGNGPLCWGNIIPSISKLDHVINPNGPPEITPDIRIYHTRSLNLSWSFSNHDERGTSGQFSVPAGVGIGMRIGVDLGTSFKNTVKSFWQFESLDTYIFQPTLEYIEDVVESEEVQTYLKRRGALMSTSLFMITGIMVARGATRQVSESQNRNLHGGGPEVDLTGVAKMGLTASTSGADSISSSTKRADDFVWAIRLAKISKEGLFDRRWSFHTVTDGATFSSDSKITRRKEMIEVLAQEGFIGEEPFDFDPDGDIIVQGTAQMEL